MMKKVPKTTEASVASNHHSGITVPSPFTPGPTGEVAIDETGESVRVQDRAARQ
jgi:hypothetical protein